MGQYIYLINEDQKICVEAYKYSGCGEIVKRIEEPELLVSFLEHCRVNNLKIQVVSEHFFNNNDENYYNTFIQL